MYSFVMINDFGKAVVLYLLVMSNDGFCSDFSNNNEEIIEIFKEFNITSIEIVEWLQFLVHMGAVENSADTYYLKDLDKCSAWSSLLQQSFLTKEFRIKLLKAFSLFEDFMD